ncbi:stealth family protein [Salinispora arenicola]|nr:stealth conserved region 3 domain-containing protein [Salinispora arenicola]MCN0178063.1 stealth family protein [Salinispora arenicola]
MYLWRVARMAVPRQLRRRAIRIFPPTHRLWFVRRVVRLPQSRVLSVRPGTGLVEVRTGVGRPRTVARVDAAASPLDVRRANINRVVDALEGAGVPYFRVPHQQVGRTALGVLESWRDRVDTLVRVRLAGEGARVATVGIGSGSAEGGPARVVRVCWPVTDPRGNLVLGDQYACEIEFWREQDGQLVAPRSNPSVSSLAADAPIVEAPEATFDGLWGSGSTSRYRTRRPFLVKPMDAVDFPIDVVYTWVDGADPDWLARKSRALAENGWVSANRQAANGSRFVSRDELRYSMRSLHYHAPWVRNVFLVTDDQVPEWLNVDNSKLRLVSHREIFGDTGRLPTFNSHAIESRLHRIPGLAEHFLYLNDDVFFGRPVTPQMFFTPSGNSRLFLSRQRVGSGPPLADEPPVMSAGKNNRAVIEREFGRFLAQKTKHTPHAARRSVLEEIERRCPDEVLGTAGRQFRHPADISMVSSLQHYWAYLTNRAVLGDIAYMYTDLADPATPIQLANALRHRNHEVFCLNDTDAEGLPVSEQAALLQEFLPAYYPFRSQYEIIPSGVPGPGPLPHDPSSTEVMTATPL